MTPPRKSKNSSANRDRETRAAVDLICSRGCAPGELARLLGLSQPFVTRARGVGMPRRSDGRHDVAAVVRWVRDRDRERMPNGTRAESVTLERWRGARADVAELARDAQRGTLVDRAEVVRDLGTACFVVRNRLLGSVKKSASILGPLIPGTGSAAFVEQILMDEVLDTLAGFWRGLDRWRGDDAGDDAAEREAAKEPPTEPTPDASPSTLPGIVENNPPVIATGNN